jgi:cysteine desulfurase / selenocysteine lyase
VKAVKPQKKRIDMETMIQEIRAQFPILSEKIYGKNLIYLDNGATTQKPQRVIDRMVEGYTKNNANIHRGVHYLSQRATELHEQARARVQQFIHAKEASEIIFTRGTTEAINLVAFSFGETFCGEGDEIVVTQMEHHSNIVPWQMLCKRKGMKLNVVSINEQGELDLLDFKSKLNQNVRLVAMTHVSNVLGTVNPIQTCIELAHQSNIPVLVDAAQSAPHVALDVVALDVDFLAFSAHKVYGPTGMGVLYGKSDYLNRMVPYQGGGEMIDQVRFEETTYNVLPYKFEAGTPDFIGSTAFAEALNFVDEIGINRIHAYENSLLQYATDELKKLDGLQIIGNAHDKSAVISFLLGNIHPFDCGTLLDHLGIAVRTGHHCAQPLVESLGLTGTVRASLAMYNTAEEVDILVKGLKRIQQMF